MNEQIRELAEQATIKEEYYPAGCNGYPEYSYDFDKEKFAQLLILKCIDLLVDEEDHEVAKEIVYKRLGVEL
jgi:hypothetical protein